MRGPFPEKRTYLVLIFLRDEFIKTCGNFSQNRIDPPRHAVVRVHMQFAGCAGLFGKKWGQNGEGANSGRKINERSELAILQKSTPADVDRISFL